MSEPWKGGWALGTSALYLDKPPGSEYVGIYIQYDNEPHQVGILLDQNVAAEFHAWMEAAISTVGLANAALVDALQEEQRRG